MNFIKSIFTKDLSFAGGAAFKSALPYVYGGLAAASIVAAWWVYDTIGDAREANVRSEYAAQIEAQKEEARQVYKVYDEAVIAAQIVAKEKEDALKIATNDNAVLAKRLRNATSSPSGLATASASTSRDYARTCGDVLAACTDEYQLMAKEADRGAIAAETLMSQVILDRQYIDAFRAALSKK